jgi:hypothetical protein
MEISIISNFLNHLIRLKKTLFVFKIWKLTLCYGRHTEGRSRTKQERFLHFCRYLNFSHLQRLEYLFQTHDLSQCF